MKKYLLIGFIILLVIPLFLLVSKLVMNGENSFNKKEINIIETNQAVMVTKQKKFAERQTPKKVNETVYDETVYDDDNKGTSLPISSDTDIIIEFHTKEKKVSWTRNKITNAAEITNNDEMTIVNPEDGVYYKPIR